MNEYEYTIPIFDNYSDDEYEFYKELALCDFALNEETNLFG